MLNLISNGHISASDAIHFVWF